MKRKFKRLRVSTAGIIAFALFAAGVFAVAVNYATDRSLQKAEIIVVPFFGETADQQSDPWAVHLEDFLKYGNPLYYWEQITN